LCGFSPPHFCGCWKPAVSFIATAKTSYTAGTLCAICFEISWEIIDKLKIFLYYCINYILNPYKKFPNSLYYKELHENSVRPMGETIFSMFII
jgi:hypothetical protein